MKDLIRKILKESEEDFSWVPKISEMELVRDGEHRQQIIDDIIDNVKEYKGWRIRTDNWDGVVYWDGEGGYTGMATPEWSDHFEIPVDISWEDDYDSITVIRTPEFKYVVEVVDWYKNHYFETVYNILTSYINDDEVPTIIEFA